MRLRLWSLFCVLALFSCQKVKETPKFVSTRIPQDIEIRVPDIMPELENFPGMTYVDVIGYCLNLGEKTWSRTWTAGEASIPAQTSSFTFTSSWIDRPEDFTGWVAEDVARVLLEDVRIPEYGEEFDSGRCDATARLTISLDADAPYRKVTLSDLDIDFPESVWAEIDGEFAGSIPELEVTPEGTVVDIHLSGFSHPDRFRDAQGRRCLSFENKIFSLVTASPEDAVGDVVTPPSELTFHCSLEFDRIEFYECNLQLSGPLRLPADELVWDPVPLPSYFCGDKADVVLGFPRIRMEYRSDVPFASALNVTARNGEAETSFRMPGSGSLMFMPREDGWYWDGIGQMSAPGLENLFCSPFPDGAIHPSLVFQPPVPTESITFYTGREYRMDAKASWIVPLYFKGQLNIGEFETPPLVLESVNLGAAPGCRHRVTQEIGSHFPFEVEITPVFEIEGESPQYLETFRMNAASVSKKISITFAPAQTPWSATLRYIVKPLRASGNYLYKGDGLGVADTVFSANLVETEDR